jgi:hypothetical protein
MPAMWFDLFGFRGCKVSKWSRLLDIVAMCHYQCVWWMNCCQMACWLAPCIVLMSMLLYLCTLKVWVLWSFICSWLQFVLDNVLLTGYSSLDSILNW